MNPYTLKMDRFGSAILVDTEIWSKKDECFLPVSLIFDTGAAKTTIATDILVDLGYDVTEGKTKRIITASSVEYVKEIQIDRIRLAQYETEPASVYSHLFPAETYTSGVIGLDILSRFDIHLLFSKRIIELYPIEG